MNGSGITSGTGELAPVNGESGATITVLKHTVSGRREIQVGGITASVRPSAWWRDWPVLRHLPFFVGRSPRFTFMVSGPTASLSLPWFTVHASNQRDFPNGSDSMQFPPGVHSARLPMLDHSGKQLIDVGTGGDHVTAYTFSVVTFEGFIVKFLAPLVVGGTFIALASANLVKG